MEPNLFPVANTRDGNPTFPLPPNGGTSPFIQAEQTRGVSQQVFSSPPPSVSQNQNPFPNVVRAPVAQPFPRPQPVSRLPNSSLSSDVQPLTLGQGEKPLFSVANNRK